MPYLEVLLQAQRAVQTLLTRDTYTQFLLSDEFQEMTEKLNSKMDSEIELAEIVANQIINSPKNENSISSTPTRGRSFPNVCVVPGVDTDSFSSEGGDRGEMKNGGI